MYSVTFNRNEAGRDIPQLKCEPMVKYEKALNHFLSDYHISQLELASRRGRRIFTSRKDRVCRFCYKGYGTVPFDDTTPIVQIGIGKKHTHTDDICAYCEEKLERFAGDLMSYLSLDITFTVSETLNKQPIRKSRIDKSKAKPFALPFTISQLNIGTDHRSLLLNHSKGTINLQLQKRAVVPQNIYKAMLKMALMFLNPGKINNYRRAVSFLFGDFIPHNINKKDFRIDIWVYPLKFDKPMLMMMERHSNNINMPEHIFIFVYDCFSLQIALPGWEKETVDSKLRHPVFPPMFKETFAKKYGEPVHRKYDASSAKSNTPKNWSYKLEKNVRGNVRLK